jgi:hypothetical protein
MEIKGILYEDFVNYKKPSMLVIFPKCDFKCDKECGSPVCQNSVLAGTLTQGVAAETLVKMYLKNDFTSALVCAGLEPFDTFEDLKTLIQTFREKSSDDIVIYTGYKEEEINELVNELTCYNNIYIKFGRFVPNQKPHFDEVLGINLASDNQYGKKVS